MARQLNNVYMPATIFSSATKTATGVSTFTMPADVHSSVFILDVTAASGTSPTLDLQIQSSPDNGTTYYNCFRFAQATAAAIQRLVAAYWGDATNTGTTGTNANSGNCVAITASTSGALATGCPINPAKMQVRYLIGGTNPSFTFVVYAFHRVLGTGIGVE